MRARHGVEYGDVTANGAVPLIKANLYSPPQQQAGVPRNHSVRSAPAANERASLGGGGKAFSMSPGLSGFWPPSTGDHGRGTSRAIVTMGTVPTW